MRSYEKRLKNKFLTFSLTNTPSEAAVTVNMTTWPRHIPVSTFIRHEFLLLSVPSVSITCWLFVVSDVPGGLIGRTLVLVGIFLNNNRIVRSWVILPLRR